jgi:hypothetical protein
MLQLCYYSTCFSVGTGDDAHSLHFVLNSAYILSQSFIFFSTKKIAQLHSLCARDKSVLDDNAKQG